jgi:protein SCO1/2
MRRVISLLFIAMTFVACAEEKQAKPLSEPGEKLYDVQGKIVSRDARSNSVMLDHRAIPGFMEAMTMEYPVRGAEVATLPADNAPIVAKMHVTERSYWLTDVKKAP